MFMGSNKQLKTLARRTATVEIDIDEEGVRYIQANKTLGLRWYDILAIKQSKRALFFIPRTTEEFVISVPDANRQEVLDAVEKAGHSDLVLPL